MTVEPLESFEFTDGEDVEFIEGLEAILSVSFPEEELAKVITMADLHDLVIRTLPANATAAGLCASQMAFYRIRRAMMAKWPRASIRPDVELSQFSGSNPGTLFAELRKASGLTLPHLPSGFWGSIAGSLVGVSAIILIWSIAFQHNLLVVASGAFALVLFLACVAPKRLPGHLKTVGDLARLSGALSYKKLATEGVRADAKMIWDLLVEEASFFGSADHRAVTPQTRMV